MKAPPSRTAEYTEKAIGPFGNTPRSDVTIIRRTGTIDAFDAFGCRVNDLSPEALFACYQRVGFLYPEKVQRLQSVWPKVLETWRRLTAAGTKLFAVVSSGEPNSDTWASVTSWRCTTHGWCTQHLASVGDPLASRAVMLSKTCHLISRERPVAEQCWFRPANRYPNRIFGTLPAALGAAHAACTTLHFVEVPFEVAARPGVAGPGEIAPVRVGPCRELMELAASARSAVFAEGEELGAADLELAQLDNMYRAVGLRRFRRVWMAFAPGTSEPVAAVVAYRGPLGLNLSFLENRCDLLVRPGIAPEIRGSAVAALLRAAQPVYEDFELQRMFVATDALTRSALCALGARPIREYAQSIWRGTSLAHVYRHIDGFFQRMLCAVQRQQRGSASDPRHAPPGPNLS